MSYASYYEHHRRFASVPPFVKFTESFGETSETAYDVFDTFGRFISRAVRDAGTKMREYKSVKAVSGLSDEVLKDIGVQRSEIRYVARRVAENPGLNYRTFCQ